MAYNLGNISHKLMRALNSRGYKLTFSNRQFLGVEGEVHSYYSINQSHWDKDKHKYIAKELYSTPSMTRIVLYLRDMWYKENGWDLPKDQEKWNAIRKGLDEKERFRSGQYGSQSIPGRQEDKH